MRFVHATFNKSIHPFHCVVKIQNATLTQAELMGANRATIPVTPITEIQDSIQMVVSTELMYQKISATPLNSAQRLQSLLDSSGNPICETSHVHLNYSNI